MHREPSNPPAQVRTLTPADAQIGFALRLEALRTHPRAFLKSAEEAEEEGVEEIRTRLGADSKEARVLGAWVDGELVGTLGIFRPKRRQVRHRAGIWGVFVKPSYRRRGIASELLNRAVEICRQLGIERVDLAVEVGNEAARQSYLKAGFKPWGIEVDAFRVDGVAVDEEHMALVVNR